MPPPAGTGIGPADHEVPFHLAAENGPTAWQEVAEVHDTAEYAGPGVGCGCQEVPFHTAAASPELELPTASQNVAETHDTAVRIVEVDGLGWIFQADPSHTSASVGEPPALPTASQNVAEAHDTPLSVLEVAPRGTTARWLVHDVPFHTCIRTGKAPPASQALLAAHDTPCSSVRAVPTALGGY